jgi:hypothetical protein
VEQIVAVLEEAEVGIPVAELIRNAGISEQTFYLYGLITNPHPPDQSNEGHSCFHLLQYRDNLFHVESLLPHGNPPMMFVYSNLAVVVCRPYFPSRQNWGSPQRSIDFSGCSR